MKKSAIADIYFGRKGNHETIIDNEEYWQGMNDSAKYFEELEEGLTEKQKEVLKKFELASMQTEGETAKTHFIEGFKLGLLLGIECMED